MNSRVEIDIRVPYETRYLSLIGKIGEDLARTLRGIRGDREELAYQINLVLTEAMANAIHHAKCDEGAPAVHISLSVDRDRFVIRVYDQGQGFDLEELPEPNLQSLDEGGRGIYLMRSVMDSVSYRKLKDGQVLEMIKDLT